MSLLPEDKKELLRDDFKIKLVDPVKIVMFSSEVECRYCSQTRKIVEEFDSLSDKVSVDIYDFVKDQAKAKAMGIDKVPALAIIGRHDYGVRYYGMPYGYELQTLIETIINVSKGTTDLSEKTQTLLKNLSDPVNIKVFVTLTCPHCPTVAAIAYKLAIACDLIKTDVIESSEFSDLAAKYSVMGVPKVIVNDKVDFLGEFNETLFVKRILLESTSKN